MFPRIDLEKEREILEEIQEKNKQKQLASQEKQQEKKQVQKDEKTTVAEDTPYIGIEDFSKVELRIGEVIQCEKVEGADKLLKSQIKIGDEVRQIVSGIAKHYSPEEMIGKKVIVVTNLKPVKLRGVLSEGMILAASDQEGNLVLASTDQDIASGAQVK